MRAYTNKPFTAAVGAGLLLIACQDLSLVDPEDDSRIDTAVGGSSSSGGHTPLGGAAPSGGVVGIGGAASSSGTFISGGANAGGAVGGSNPATGGTSPASLGGGGAAQGGGGSGGRPPSSGGRASGGNTVSGGTASTPLSTGGSAPSGGATTSTLNSGGVSQSGGSSASAGSAATGGTLSVTSATGGFTSGGAQPTTTGTGGSPETGGTPSSGAPVTSGGAQSTGGNSSAAAGGGTLGAGGSFANGGASASGGTTNSGVATVSTLGGTTSSSTSTSGLGGLSGAGGTTSDLREAALNWQPCDQHITTFAQSPQDLQRMLVGCSNGDVYLTFDGLSTNPNPHWLRVDSWTTIGAQVLGLPDAPVNAIAYSPTDVNTAYIAFAGSKQGRKLWKTTTNGADWFEISNCPFSEVWGVSVNPLDSQKVYIYGPDGTDMSPDGGETWTAEVTVEPLKVQIAAGAKLNTVSVVPGQPDIIWVGATNGDIFYTENATSEQTWFRTKQDTAGRMVTRVTLDISRSPVGPFATYEGMAPETLWASSVYHLGWGLLGVEGLPITSLWEPRTAFYGISINPIDDSIFYINGTYGVGMSTTMGTSWTWTDLP